ncbi:MAG: ImmA/IrrE family metallo-endopeptidase [Candidatus Omnitrophota bacterium]|jgi:HTH-type transcriptional regulator/antitoxin HigA
MMNINEFRTPGQLLDALTKSKNWNQRLLAVVLGMDETGINRLIADKRPVTAELALIFQDLFDVPAEKFLELQKSYDLGKARLTQIPDPERNLRAHLFGGLPVTEMVKRGWIKTNDIRDVSTVESGLTKFFGVKNINEIEILPHAAKKTAVVGDVTPTQLAWLYRVKQITSDLITPKYSLTSVKNAISNLQSLLLSPQEIRKVPRILTESGIRFVLVESLPTANIDGVCLWLDDERPVIAMSLRHDRIDNFWFVLRHEIEHVLRRHGQAAIMLDTELVETLDDATSKEEKMANLAASEFCVPSKSMDKFMERKSPIFTERDMIGFARSLNIHPGLVVGQLHHRTGRYELFNKYLVKVRNLITTSAIVDGWGNVAPTAS